MLEIPYKAIYVENPDTHLHHQPGKRSKGGRGNAFWKNPDKIQRLIDAFTIDANIKEACFYAGISRSQYYEYKKKNPDIVQEWEDHRLIIHLMAKKNIADRIFAGDAHWAWKFLTRRDPDFMPRCGKCQYHESHGVQTYESEVSDEEWEEVKQALGY